MRHLMPLLAAAALVLLTTAANADVGDQLFKLLATDGETGDHFGISVAISGATAIVGAYGDDDNGGGSGSAYLFDTTTGQQIAKLLANDGELGDFFARSVAISAGIAIVGASQDDDNGGNSGSAYLFDTTAGQQIAKLLADDGAEGDLFGSFVAISGATAIVGAHGDDDNGGFSGSAYLFDATTGQQIAKLLASDGAAGDLFGARVAISGPTAIVGAPNDDDNGGNSGSAYLFDTTTGQQIAKLLPDDGSVLDLFGGSVAIGGATAVVGAGGDDDNGEGSGSAYLFDTTSGQQIAKLLADDGPEGGHFGSSAAINGTTAIVGAYRDDDNGSGSGSAYLFDTATGQQIAKLLPSDGAEGDQFGYSVAISGATAIVGAHSDDDNGGGSGSAYVFAGPEPQPTIAIRKARMVSPDQLGVDLGVYFPPSDGPDQSRFVCLSAVVNGTPISKGFDVSELVEAGEVDPGEQEKRIEFDWGDDPRVLDFAQSGVPRFEGNQEFTLTAEAYTSDGLASAPTTESVEIYLPIVIIHGYMGPGLGEQIFGRIAGPVVYGSLSNYLRDETQGDFVTGYTTDDSWYHTVWLGGEQIQGLPNYYHKSWTPEQVQEWLEDIVDQARDATYANRVNLVSHSLGGLIARYYTCCTNESNQHSVHKIIMIGTPNLGSSSFYEKISELGWSRGKVIRTLTSQHLLRWVIPTYDCLYDCIRDDECAESSDPTDWILLAPDPDVIRPESDWPYPEDFTDNLSPPAGVTYYSIYSACTDEICAPWRGWDTPYILQVEPATRPNAIWYSVEADLDESEGDGTVMVGSADLTSACNYPLLTEKRHGSLPADPEVQARVLEALRDE